MANYMKSRKFSVQVEFEFKDDVHCYGCFFLSAMKDYDVNSMSGGVFYYKCKCGMDVGSEGGILRTKHMGDYTRKPVTPKECKYYRGSDNHGINSNLGS